MDFSRIEICVYIYILTLNLEMECDFGSPEGSLAFGADLHAVYEDYFMPRSESTSDLSGSGSEASSESDENASYGQLAPLLRRVSLS